MSIHLYEAHLTSDLYPVAHTRVLTGIGRGRCPGVPLSGPFPVRRERKLYLEGRRVRWTVLPFTIRSSCLVQFAPQAVINSTRPVKLVLDKANRRAAPVVSGRESINRLSIE